MLQAPQVVAIEPSKETEQTIKTTSSGWNQGVARVAKFTRDLCSRQTPLGLPVEPEV